MLTTSTDPSRALRVAALALAALLSPPLAACARSGAPGSSSPGPDASADLPDASLTPDGATADAAEPADAGLADVALASDAGPPAQRSTEPPRALDAKLRALAGDEPRALVRGGANEDVSPESRFEIDLPRLADFRVRLLDEADRAVASTDRAELTERLRYHLSPVDPLAPGSRHALVIDGLRAELSSDDQGRIYELLRIEFKTSGEKPKPASKRPKVGKSRKKKRAR